MAITCSRRDQNSGFFHNKALFFDGNTMSAVSPDQETRASGINDGNDVVLNLSSDQCHQALMMTGDGQRIELGTLQCDREVARGLYVVNSLNFSRQAVGNTHAFDQLGRSLYYHAAIWEAGSTTDLGALGGNNSMATAINDAGAIAGFSQFDASSTAIHAFIYTGGQMQDLGTLGGSSSWAFGINGDGAVVGGAMLSDETNHAFLWDGSAMQDLGMLPGSTSSSADSINASWNVVGKSGNIDGSQGFLYDGTVMYDLNDLIAPSDWTILQAKGINDSGQIAGVGTHVENGSTVKHALLLSPQ